MHAAVFFAFCYVIQHQRVCTTHRHLKQIPSCPADLRHHLVTSGVAADVWGCFWALFCSQGTTLLPGLPSCGRILLGAVVVGGEAASKGRRTCPSSLLRGLLGLFLQMGLPPGLPLASQAGPLCPRAFVPAGAPPGCWPQVLALPALLASSSSETFL